MAIICFFYVFIGALFQPLKKKTDQMLQYVTSIQLFSTLCTGLLLRNRMFERMQGIGDEKDDIVVDVALTFTTLIVFVCIGIVVLYVVKDTCCPKREKGGEKRGGGGKKGSSGKNSTKIVPEEVETKKGIEIVKGRRTETRSAEVVAPSSDEDDEEDDFL